MMSFLPRSECITLPVIIPLSSTGPCMLILHSNLAAGLAERTKSELMESELIYDECWNLDTKSTQFHKRCSWTAKKSPPFWFCS